MILGDLFDSSRPEPQVVTGAIGALSEGPNRVITLLGNHDMNSEMPGDHALGSLAWVDGFSVIDRSTILPIGDVDLILIPFKLGRACEWFPRELASVCQDPRFASGEHPPPRPRILVFHLGISTENTPHYLQDSPDSLPIQTVLALAKQYRISAVFAGNWHNHFVERTPICTIVQVGALVPTGFDNPGFDYGFMSTLYNDLFIDVNQINGPRFVTVQSQTEARKASEKALAVNIPLYLRWLVSDPQQLAFFAQLFANAVAAGRFCDGVVELNKEVVATQARQAVEVARSSETLAEALASFIRAMPLQAGISAEEVLLQARKYLGL